MKNLLKSSFILLAVASLTFLASCGDTEDPLPDGPIVEVTAASEVEEGNDIELTVNITALGGFDRFTLSEGTTFIKEYSAADFANVEDGTVTAFTEVITITTDATAGATLEFSVNVVDKNNLEASDEVSVDVVSPEARTYTAVLLAAPLGTTTAEKTSETFFSTNTGLTYSMKTINESSDPLSANIDFGYFYGANTGATLSDPASYPFAYGQAAWGVRNSTTFRRTALSAAAFAEVTTFAAIDAAFEAATAADSDAGIESGLEAGEVLAFETDADKTGGSKRGLILVNSIVTGAGENGQISIEVIVQEDAE